MMYIASGVPSVPNTSLLRYRVHTYDTHMIEESRLEHPFNPILYPCPVYTWY